LIEQILAGQLVVASLLSRNIKTRLLLRDPAKAVTLFGEQDESVFQVILHPESLNILFPSV
jgi:uncharacterized protein YbjT (DUF2867 family)